MAGSEKCATLLVRTSAISLSGGATHVDSIDISTTAQLVGGGTPEFLVYKGGFFNDSWVGAGTALLGVEFIVACHWAIGVNGAESLVTPYAYPPRQKTAILLGLIRPFSVLLVDEPFIGLDPPGRAAFIDLLDDAGNAGATVVVATHQLDYAKKTDRCVGLRDGAVIYDGPPDGVDLDALVG